MKTVSLNDYFSHRYGAKDASAIEAEAGGASEKTGFIDG